MVKTEQGSGYTGRKRGRRGGFRDPAIREMVRNSEISPSSELTPASSKRYRTGSDDDGRAEYQRLYYAQMETLIFYFDEEWFDFDTIISKETQSGDIGKKNSVFRCEFCLKPWSIGERHSDVEYYSRNTFKNIPMENKTCQECVSVLPADIE